MNNVFFFFSDPGQTPLNHILAPRNATTTNGVCGIKISECASSLIMMAFFWTSSPRSHFCLFHLGFLVSESLFLQRRKAVTKDEILKVSHISDLCSANSMLKWQLALRAPYLDPVNIMQVFVVGAFTGTPWVARVVYIYIYICIL